MQKTLTKNTRRSVAVAGPAWLEVDLDKLRRNIARLRSLVPDGTKVMAVVKAQAYGTGAEMAAKTAIESGVEMLAVARVAEGVHLRHTGIKHPILNLGYLADEDIETALACDLINTIYNIEVAHRIQQAAARMGLTAKIHINIDTGMGRIGVLPEDVEAVVSKILRMDKLAIKGFYSHFPSADEEDNSFSLSQVKSMCLSVEKVAPLLEEKPLLHMANTAATMTVPESHFDMVRQGIGIYGAYGSERLSRSTGLELIAAFRTIVAHIKRVPAGTPISYGRTSVTTKPTTIATLPVGYADGVNRKLSNTGEVLIHGRRFPIVGRVTMDHLMVDIGDNSDIEIGHIATIMGRDGTKEITADDIAALTGTIAYEVLTNISARIPRLYLKSGKVVRHLKNGLI